ncbi:PP2C family protein-serine/threonine phosphatase [Natranaerobius trueperi]|uniref:Serine/threonine protein phosphatase n=1 Tax=Natranaerobius trueperi TaxID=759412 RepID=A0A226BZJ2_9FIRM|nr:PP2C family protein-serine/threonine phosphatase [Natranaerobius trueperi]OWZ83609.1 serine/threonine protein phosphatase [Natranaerobius trueperi]
MKVEITTDKIPKYASGESGDSFEIVERPQGGVSAILADGQGSGKSAKLTSNMVASKASTLIADGTRDGAVARATHDFLFAQKRGRVSATLTLLSCDLRTNTLVISRNTNCPTIVKRAEKTQILKESVKPIGFHNFVKPTIDEIPIQPGTIVIAFTDGIYHSGRKFNNQITLEEIANVASTHQYITDISREILNLGLSKDKNRPQDDMSVLVLGIFSDESKHKPRSVRVSYSY